MCLNYKNILRMILNTDKALLHFYCLSLPGDDNREEAKRRRAYMEVVQRKEISLSNFHPTKISYKHQQKSSNQKSLVIK